MNNLTEPSFDQTGRQAFAPAKVNLFLAVRNRRPDQRHDLETVFLPVPGLHDQIEILARKEPGLEIECDHPQVPADQTNLCHRAAIVFAEATGLQPSWKIKIHKRIPIAAGLGGGSSDAAATLLLLSQFTGRQLTSEHLHQLARKLGSDVPFFLNPSPALAHGPGDELTKIELNCRIPLLLLNPGGFPLSAVWAYKQVADRFDKKTEKTPLPLLKAMREGDLDKIGGSTYNRFDQPVRRKLPLIEIFFDFLRRQGCLATHISGSGPTVFAICKNLEHAAAVAAAAGREFGGNAWTWHGEIEVSDILIPGKIKWYHWRLM